MFARAIRRQALTKPQLRSTRAFATHSVPSPRVSRSSAAKLTASFLLGFGFSTYADASRDPERVPTPLSKLVTSYVVYSMCSIPGLVDASPSLLSFCTSVPVLRQITEAFVRATFFSHFVGGDTAHACLPLIRQLRAENKGALFAYSVEVDEHEAAGGARSSRDPAHKLIVQEMIRSIDVAADFEDSQALAADASPGSGRRTWVAIKLSALLPNPAALFNLSKYLASRHAHDPILFPGCPHIDDLSILRSTEPSTGSPLTAQDLADLRELHSDLTRICNRAKERNVRLIIDAEYSWYQPALDSISLELMREFNKTAPPVSHWLPRLLSRPAQPSPPPLIYVTFQAYLRRTPEYLAQSLRDASTHNYSLGVKLVRGAYHEQEARPDSPALLLANTASWPPVFTNKADTDKCYNAAAAELVRAVANTDGRGPNVGVLFGSHNAESCAKVLDALVGAGLATREEDGVIKVDDTAAEHVTLAQLYGMSDSLTDHLAASTRTRAPFVIKYVPYGALSDVMPYLSRRAIENKSVLGNGNAASERKQAFDAIWVHIFGK
ncbi:FAD-linked oxidoreductase-like protein [Gloeopeniophorella convolvens]|nr:FAD-linked oxidoreductase-like protein [Gloeopeniophorella convolvens]